MLEIRECGPDDLDLLEWCMPTGGHQAHAGHFARQRAGTATYLVAWQAAPVGCCLILWDGCVAPEVRAALPEAVEVSNLHVQPEARGNGGALIRAAATGGRRLPIALLHAHEQSRLRAPAGSARVRAAER